MPKRIVIAIDGPASSGKGTVARAVARSLGFAYIDTGAMYRCVALLASRAGLSLSDADGLSQLTDRLRFEFVWLGGMLSIVVNGEDLSDAIRFESVGRGASNVAVHAQVRSALVLRQRAMADEGGVVMDGRDIGSVVLPDAALKIYLDASVDVRAKRRHQELIQKGQSIPLETIRAQVSERDQQDRERTESPLVQVDDAVYLDTSALSPQQAAQIIIDLAWERA